MSEEDGALETAQGRSEDDTTSEKDKDNKKRCCARCRNHETDLVELKGHKNYCPWRDCYCELCLKTVFRQKLMADQTATRRKRVEKERRAKKGLPLEVPSANEAKRLKTSSTARDQTSIVAFNPPPMTREVSWEAITELMNIFNFNVNTSCLLYLVLKYISNNVKDARSIILSAKEDIKKISNKTLNGGSTPMVQPMYTMNQLEVVPLFVLPSEKVLDLSYQPGLNYPRTSTQGYPYPRANTPPPPAPCFGWKQTFRQPTWPNPAQPFDRIPVTPYHKVPKDDKERRDGKITDKRSDLELKTPEEASKEISKSDELTVTNKTPAMECEERIGVIQTDANNRNKEDASKTKSETNVERLKDGVNEVRIKDERNHKLAVYRPFQDLGQGSKHRGYVKDEFSVYGEHIGNQLRSLTDRHSLTVARYEIDQVIFKAIMGEYYVGNCQCCLQDTSKEAFKPRRNLDQQGSATAFQPYKPTLQAPIQPQPIRPPQLNIETWSDIK